MNPEKFHDAMNHLDDDLIAETDELRQGRRTRRAARWIVPAVAAAACLALVLGIGSGTLPIWQMDNSAPIYFEGLMDAENGAPGESAMESAHGTTSQSTHEVPENWERVSNKDISLSLPAGWGYELTIADDGSYGIAFCPGGEDGMIRVTCQPGFGVCGTGLKTVETAIAGKNASAGYYDGNRIWSFITFPGTDFVIINEAADGWYGSSEATVRQILDTIAFGE